MGKPSLEQRIASALASEDIKAAALADLIEETQTAIDAADKAAEAERTKALDPTLSPDPKAARAAMEDAAFARDRLRTVLPRLQARRQEVEAQEYVSTWRADYDQVKVKRDAMVEELRDRYPKLADELVDLMSRISGIDKEVDRVNGAARAGMNDRLHRVEREARGELSRPDVQLAGPDGLRLPVLHRSGGPLYAWPLPTPSLAERLAAEFIVPRWLGPEEADRRRREENERLRKFYQDQQREREKREKAEFEKAKETDRAYWASRPI